MGATEFKTGEVYEDRDDDQWRVQDDGDLHCASAELVRSPSYVEREWGPLRKVSVHFPSHPRIVDYKDAIDESTQAAWRRTPPGRMTPNLPPLQQTPRQDYDGSPMWLHPEDRPLGGAWDDLFKRFIAPVPAPTPETVPAEPVKLELEVRPEFAKRIGEGYSPDYLAQAAKVYGDALNLLVRKSADYGPKNIAESPGGPLNGLRVRMWDKTARLNNLIDSGADPANESLRDTFVDLLNYSAIALMVMDGNWPGAKPAEGDK